MGFPPHNLRSFASCSLLSLSLIFPAASFAQTKPASANATNPKPTTVYAGRSGSLEITTIPAVEAELALCPVGTNNYQRIGISPLECELVPGDYILSASAALDGKKYACTSRIVVREGKNSPLSLKLLDSTAGSMVSLTGGIFMAGAPPHQRPERHSSDLPLRSVKINGFCIAATEVTVGEFSAFVKATDFKTGVDLMDGYGKGLKIYDYRGKRVHRWDDPYYASGDLYPVVNVNWYDCVAYANWKSRNEGLKPSYSYNGETVCMKWPAAWNKESTKPITIDCDFSANGYRLPTETEWEYAAKGGHKQQPQGWLWSGSETETEVAWSFASLDEVATGRARPVATKRTNTVGLYDMSGNVWEYCWDWYGGDLFNQRDNYRGPSSGEYKVIRGGAWNSHESLTFVFFSGDKAPWMQDEETGFRLVTNPSGKGLSPAADAPPAGMSYVLPPHEQAANGENNGVPQFVLFRLPPDIEASLSIQDAFGSELQRLDRVDIGALIRLIPGSYRVEALDSKGLYFPLIQAFSVGSEKQTIPLVFRENFGTLVVTTNMFGKPTTVSLRGSEDYFHYEDEGTFTSTWRQLKSGSYTLFIGNELYEDYSQTVTIEAGRTTSLSPDPIKNYFILDLRCPAGYQVEVNNAHVGQTPLIAKLPFEESRVRVYHTDDRYEFWEETIHPTIKGSVETRTPSFKFRTSRLQISTNPPSDAEISLRPEGTSEDRFLGMAPLNAELVAGVYDLTAKARIDGIAYAGKLPNFRVSTSVMDPIVIDLSKASLVPLAEKPFSIGMTMIEVAGGSFTLGDTVGDGESDERPLLQLTLGGFLMSATEVTQAQWMAVMGDNPSLFLGDDLPVQNVSWYDCVAFCNKLSKLDGLEPAYTIKGDEVSLDPKASGYRLPLEEEWEYAAKGGPRQQAMDILHSGSNNLFDIMEPGAKKPYAVANKRPNGAGLYDMTGNVAEWCWEWGYESDYRDRKNNSKARSSRELYGNRFGGRIYRGGCFGSFLAELYRVSDRNYAKPESRYEFLGFRVVRSKS